MDNQLRDPRTPSDLAASGQIIEFSEKISNFEQLAAIVESDLDTLDPDKLPSNWRDATVFGQLTFGFADAHSGLPVMRGEAEVTIDAVCQRCLQPFRVPLAADLRLVFGKDAARRVEDEGYEVWELEEGKLRPLDLVAEALVMAMPISAMHDDDATCRGPEMIAEDLGKRMRPFAGLKSQMEKKDRID